MQDCDFVGGESKTQKTSITKTNSKMQYLEEFYWLLVLIIYLCQTIYLINFDTPLIAV